MVAKINNDCVEITAVIGKYGFIIRSVRDIKHKKEWLYGENEQGERDIAKTFDEQYKGGMEFLFPGDEEERFEGRLYRDHGQLWRMPYTCQAEKDELKAEGIDKNFGISTEILMKLNNNHIEIAMTVKNIAERAIPYLLRLHPAFEFNENTKLTLHSKDIIFEQDGTYCSFSQDSEEYREVDLENPGTFKDYEVFLHLYQKQGRFTVEEEGRTFTAEYDNKKLPYLTYCSFIKDNVRLGILEPANVPGVRLASVSARKTVPILKPGEEINYKFIITLE